MKVIAAFLALVAVASAGYLSPYSYSYASPYAALPYSAYPYSVPLAYSTYAAPAIQSGYVAATRGSLHTAPLPEGPFAASHHINTLPAPGTF